MGDNNLMQYFSTFGWWKITGRTTTTAPTAEAAEAEEVVSAGIEMVKYTLEVNGECDGIERTLEEWEAVLEADWQRMQAEESEIQPQLMLMLMTWLLHYPLLFLLLSGHREMQAD